MDNPNTDEQFQDIFKRLKEWKETQTKFIKQQTNLNSDQKQEQFLKLL